ncbi:MAG: response regulator [Anaerolineae bacterium]|nr:MAG: response regulator [Anaerolineae bacterium]
MTPKKVLLTVGTNKRNLELLAEFLGKGGYRTLSVTGLDEFDRTLEETQEIGLALVDISGFDVGIWERCARLREKHIPLFIISPKHSAAIQQESVTHGARGVLVKPLVVRELIGIVSKLIEDSE